MLEANWYSFQLSATMQVRGLVVMATFSKGCLFCFLKLVFNMASHDDGASKIAKAAVLSFFATCLIIIIAFSTNSWLETDGTLENPKFIQLGE